MGNVLSCGHTNKRRLFGLIGTTVLAVFLFASCGCQTAAAAGEQSGEWRVTAIDKLEWAGIEKDRQRLPHRTPEVLSFGGAFVVEGKDGTPYVIYWPTKDGLTQYRDTALMVASFNPEKGPESISRKRIETGVFLGEEREQGYANGIPMQAVEGQDGLQIWYFHPYERRLVCYHLTSDKRRSWDFTDILPMYNISWTWDSHWLDFFVEPETNTVRFSVYRQEGVHYATYDLETEQWSEQELPMRSSPWIMPGPDGVWLTTLAEERLFRYTMNPETGQWERKALTTVPIFRGEVMMFTDEKEQLYMLLWDYAYSLQLTEPDGELWKVTRVKQIPREKAQQAGKRDVFFAISAAFAPDGTLHLCWHHPLEEKLQHLWRRDGKWYQEDIASPGKVYGTTMVHTGERLMVSYVDMADEKVYVASKKAGDADRGTEFDVPGAVHYLPLGGKQVSWLHMAAGNGDVDRVKELLTMGAHVNGADGRGATPLHYAVLGGSTEAVKLLLDAGASVNAHDQGARTPLHAAAYSGSPEIMSTLIEAGASVKTADDTGATPLHLAVMEANVDAARVLLQNGARADVKNNEGQTPLSLARESENQELINLLTGI